MPNDKNNNFIDGHRNEILDAAEPALGIVDTANLKRFCMPFDAKEKEIRQFVVNFINVSIADENLRNKMLEHFKTFDLKTWTSKEAPNEVGSVKGSVDRNGHVKKIDRWAYIGKRKWMGNVKTDLSVVRCIIHEIFHSVSAKHDIDKIKQHEQIVDRIKKEDEGKSQRRALPSFERDSSVGEVESIFSEMLFNHILKTRLDELKVDGKPLFGLSDEEIQFRVEELESFDLREFVGKSNSSLDKNSHKDNDYWFRYVRGYILATGIEKQYMANPAETMKKLNVFLEEGNTMGPEEVAKLFYEGQLNVEHGQNLNYYQHAVKDFKETLTEKFSKYSIGPQVERMGVHVLREEIQQKHEFEQRQKELQKNLDAQEQERENS